MTLGVLFAVLGAAFLHALWNALIKLGTSRLGGMVILSVAEVPIGLAVALSSGPIEAAMRPSSQKAGLLVAGGAKSASPIGSISAAAASTARWIIAWRRSGSRASAWA